MTFAHDKSEEEELEEEDGEAGIDDSMLDEISENDAAEAETEGFGHIKEDDGDDDEEEDADDGDESLEDDAEDVDYDSFDDEDHL